MATELAVTTGVGTIVLDVRRGDGPPGCFDYTMPVLATTERLIERSPDTAAAAVRALVTALRRSGHRAHRPRARPCRGRRH
jgi:NitT/TauT family transport system substrate-binding protein